jgi:hypothetical protein
MRWSLASTAVKAKGFDFQWDGPKGNNFELARQSLPLQVQKHGGRRDGDGSPISPSLSR